MDGARDLAELAKGAVRALDADGNQCLLIGALALAAHGYARHTTDIDLGVAMPPRDFVRFAEALASTDGVYAEFDEAGPSDPLGGVINIYLDPPEEDDDTDPDDWNAPPEDPPKVQIVNFDNAPAGGFPRLVTETLQRSRETSRVVGAPLPTLEDIILFKAYAGGHKSRNDVAELLTRAKPDIQLLRERARQYNMSRDLEYVLDDLV